MARRGRSRHGKGHRRAGGPSMAQVTTIVLMGGMLAFVLLFKDSFSSGIANFMNRVAPATSDLVVPDPQDAADASEIPGEQSR